MRSDQQMVAAPCSISGPVVDWTDFLLQQLDRTQLESIFIGRGWRGCPSAKSELVSYIMENGSTVFNDTEYELYKFAYRKGFQTDPIEVQRRSQEIVGETQKADNEIIDNNDEVDPEEIANDIVDDGCIDSKLSEFKLHITDMFTQQMMRHEELCKKVNEQTRDFEVIVDGIYKHVDKLNASSVSISTKLESKVDALMNSFNQLQLDIKRANVPYMDDKVTMRRKVETPVHGGFMFTPMSEKIADMDDVNRKDNFDAPSFGVGLQRDDSVQRQEWLQMGQKFGNDMSKLIEPTMVKMANTPMMGTDKYVTPTKDGTGDNAPTVISVSSSLKDVATYNEKKAKVRINMGYRMPVGGYLESFWLLPPQWQKERPDGIPIMGEDSQINSGILKFLKRRVDQAAAQLVSQVHPLKDGPYSGSDDSRSWHTVEREIVNNLNRSCLDIAKVHVDYLLDCVTQDLSQSINQRLGPNGYRDADQVELLYTVWNMFDEMFRSDFAPEAESDKMQNLKKSDKESFPEFMRRLQSAFFNVEVETGQCMVDSTKMTRMRGALPEADIQFIRSKFPRDIKFDQLVTRMGEYFSNELDKKNYETFIRSYSQLWSNDINGGYSHANLGMMECFN
ncbi:hypothetical protein FOL47_010081 [Perkinsus chesapeaki]|uniref:Uncharacterized protein n=1 Tax=Perkinsus chesapeaki TaxID=330153 RepID=A0A7J6L4X2_PERCH|nr:hypothetical protein FOL47_010081 [Perkinsus chesapeaki]